MRWPSVVVIWSKGPFVLVERRRSGRPDGPDRNVPCVAVYWQASQLSGFSREQATASSSVYVFGARSSISMLSNFGSSSADVTVGAAACTEVGATGGGGGAPQEATGGAIGGRADGAKVLTGAVTGGSGATGSAGACTGATGAVSPQPMA